MSVPPIAAAIISRVATAALETITTQKLTRALEVEVDSTQMAEALSQHTEYVANWSQTISFKDLAESKPLHDTYVDLDLLLTQDQPIASGNRLLRISDVATADENVVLLGDPGAGKTTSLKRIANHALSNLESDEAGRPILIQLRDLDAGDTLVDALLARLAIRVIPIGPINPREAREFRKQVAVRCLNALNPLLLLDGLDELHPDARDVVVADLKQLILTTKNCRYLLTCRIADYEYDLPTTRTYFISPLTKSQVRKLAIRWLSSKTAPVFLEQVSNTPYAGAEVRPLTLAHLCAIFERTGTIPERPRTIYRKIVRLMLEEWDEQRLVRRYSRYAAFEVDRKEEFLEAMAFHVVAQGDGVSFTDAQLREIYQEVHSDFGLPKSEGERVVGEIESHTGLIIEVGWERYHFVHKAVAEYLAGCYIAKLPTVPVTIGRMPDAAALATAVSSRPTDYLVSVVRRVGERSEVDRTFTAPFLRRLEVEGVDLRPGLRLGAAIIRLYSRTYYPTSRQAGPARFESMKSFLGMEAVRESITAVIDQGVIERATLPIFRLDRDDGREHFEHLTRQRELHVYPLDWEFLRATRA